MHRLNKNASLKSVQPFPSVRLSELNLSKTAQKQIFSGHHFISSMYLIVSSSLLLSHAHVEKIMSSQTVPLIMSDRHLFSKGVWQFQVAYNQFQFMHVWNKGKIFTPNRALIFPWKVHKNTSGALQIDTETYR